jgi:hypothetical protein
MDPVQPWVDPIEIRRLAEALMAPLARPNSPADDAGFNGDFVGFSQNQEATCEVGATADPMPAGSTESSVTHTEAPQVAAPTTTHETPVRGPFLERLSRFRAWLQSQLPIDGMFVLDREGSVIFDDADHSRLHFLARNSAIGAKRTPLESGRVQVRIGSSGILEVIHTETAYGRIVLGLVLHQSLSAADVAHMVTALQQAIAPPRP